MRKNSYLLLSVLLLLLLFLVVGVIAVFSGDPSDPVLEESLKAESVKEESATYGFSASTAAHNVREMRTKKENKDKEGNAREERAEVQGTLREADPHHD